jgi:hypothetical protein
LRVITRRLRTASLPSDDATEPSIATTGIVDAFGSPSVASIGPGSVVKTTSAEAPARAAFCALTKMKQVPRCASAIRPRTPLKSLASHPSPLGTTRARIPAGGVEGE